MIMTDVCVIVLNFNQARRTVECVGSLLAGTATPGRIIVVDNGSTEEPPLPAAGWATEVTYLRLATNTGYAGGNNAGLHLAANAGIRWIWVLNNDTIVDRYCLEELLRRVPDSSLSALLPAILDGRDSGYWFRGGRIDARKGFALHLQDSPDTSQPRRTHYAVGCSLLADLETWRVVGGFDESLFLYWEDVDWSLRLEKLGGQIWLVDTAVVVHDAGGSSSRSTLPNAKTPLYFKARNRLFLSRRGVFSRLGVLLATPRWAAREIRAVRVELRRSIRIGEVGALLRGLIHGLFCHVPPPRIPEI